MKKNQSFDLEFNKSRLQKYYEHTIQAPTDRTFLSGVFDYMGLFDRQEIFYQTIQKTVIKLADQDHEQLRKLEGVALKDIKSMFKIAKKYVEKSMADNNSAIKAITTFERLEKGEMRSTGRFGGLSGELFSLLRYILDEKEKHTPFIEKHGSLDDEGRLSRWNFQDSIDEYENELARLEKIQWTKIWFFWDKLAFAENVFKRYQDKRDEYFEDNNWFALMGLSTVHKEIKTILEGGSITDTRPFINIDEYRELFYKLHFYLLDLVDEIEFHGLLPEKYGASEDGSELKSKRRNEEKTRVLENINVKPEYAPHCVVEQGYGYLKIQKFGERIRISKPTSRKYKFLSYVLSNLNAELPVDQVYEQIKVASHKKKIDLLPDYYAIQEFKKNNIDQAMKDIYKIEQLKGKIGFEWIKGNSFLRATLYVSKVEVRGTSE